MYSSASLRIGSEPLDTIGRLTTALGHHDHFVYENRGTWSFACGVHAELWIDEHGAHLRAPGKQLDQATGDDPFTQVRRLLEQLPDPTWRAYGWTAFELGDAARDDTAGGDQPLDERVLHLVVPRTEVRITGAEVTVTARDQAALDLVLDTLREETPAPRPAAYLPVDLRTAGAQEYRLAVARAVAEIETRALTKVVLSRTVPVEVDIDFPRSYVAGRRANNPARSFLFSMRGLESLGFSPEMILQVDRDGGVSTQPLAGTRALTDNPEENRRLREELCADPKEVFEHAISVKTVQDELLGVCDPESLSVGQFMKVRERGTAQHLASEVSARLRSGQSAWDALRAVFPATTASGIPKPLARQHIRRHEPARGLYGGAVLTVDSDGTLDAALVLRAVYREGGRTWLRAGGGIVAGSTPDRELEETREKLRSVSRFLVPALADHPHTGDEPRQTPPPEVEAPVAASR